MSLRQIEISRVNGTIEIRNVNAPANVAECYALSAIKSVVATGELGFGARGADNRRKNPIHLDDKLEISITFHSEFGVAPINFDIQYVSNQPTWTPDLAGLEQAKTDICSWVATPIVAPGGGAVATEATLISLLNATIAHQDVEILLVRDTGNGNQVVQQLREYDETTGTWSTSYEDVSGAPYIPVGPLEYIDPSGVLNLMLTELQGLNTPVTGLAVTYDSATGAGSVTAGKRRVSFFNAGGAAADLAGGTGNLAPGESVTFSAEGLRDTLAAIAYDATGTTVKISTVG